jgi:DNA invertase Pin-like site-specific DNA recombinase
MRTIKYDRINKSNSDLNLLKPRLIVLPNGDQILNIKDICSSSVPFNQRDNFDIIINISNNKQMDTILVDSINRLGNNSRDILSTIKTFHDNGINVCCEKENIKTRNEDGSENKTIMTSINLMSSLWNYENELRKEVQKKGIDKALISGKYKNNGGKKPKLSIEDFFKKSKNKSCLEKLKKGMSIRKAAYSSGVSPAQSMKVKKLGEVSGRL